MIRKALVLIILGCLILGTALPVLASGGSDSGSSGSSESGGGSSSGNGGASSDSGSSSGNGGSSSDQTGSSGSGSSDQGRSGPGSTNGPTSVPTQEQSRDQSQVTAGPTAVPTQEQSQNLSQSQYQTELNDQYLEQIHDRQSLLLQDQQLTQDQDRLKTELALYSITIAAPVLERNATQFVDLATQVNQSYGVTDQLQTRIENRDPITRFFIGGDATAAQTLLQLTAQNQDRIRLMEQDLQNCDCNQTIRDHLQQQLTTITKDQERLRTLANQTLQDRGIFGGLFR